MFRIFFVTSQVINRNCSQYIIFPPHTTASSLDTDSRDSEGEEDADTAAGSDSVTAPTEADGEIQVGFISNYNIWTIMF